MYLYVVLYAWGDCYVGGITPDPNGSYKQEKPMYRSNDPKQPIESILGDIGPINGGDV